MTYVFCFLFYNLIFFQRNNQEYTWEKQYHDGLPKVECMNLCVMCNWMSIFNRKIQIEIIKWNIIQINVSIYLRFIIV